MAAIMEETRLLLADSIRHRLVTNGLSVAGVENDLPQQECGTADDMMDKARQSLRHLCTSLYQNHQAQFDDMLQKLHIEPNTLHDDLETIMADVFYDQV